VRLGGVGEGSYLTGPRLGPRPYWQPFASKVFWHPVKNVTIIMVMDRTLPLANVKAHLSEIVDQVESTHDRVVLTRNGRAAAVILSPDDLEALEETLDLLSQPNALEEIRKAREELDAGRFVTGDELPKRFRRP
jgi:antitoxin YefM